jgi:hypothetical protein
MISTLYKEHVPPPIKEFIPENAPDEYVRFVELKEKHEAMGFVPLAHLRTLVSLTPAFRKVVQ